MGDKIKAVIRDFNLCYRKKLRRKQAPKTEKFRISLFSSKIMVEHATSLIIKC